MPAEKPEMDKEIGISRSESEIAAGEDVENEAEFEDEDEEEYEDGFESEIETEIEHQTPEVIAKELLITFLEKNAVAYPDPRPDESRYRAIGRAIGEMYNGLLEEIRKTAG